MSNVRVVRNGFEVIFGGRRFGRSDGAGLASTVHALGDRVRVSERPGFRQLNVSRLDGSGEERWSELPASKGEVPAGMRKLLDRVSPEPQREVSVSGTPPSEIDPADLLDAAWVEVIAAGEQRAFVDAMLAYVRPSLRAATVDYALCAVRRVRDDPPPAKVTVREACPSAFAGLPAREAESIAGVFLRGAARNYAAVSDLDEDEPEWESANHELEVQALAFARAKLAKVTGEVIAASSARKGGK